MISYDDFLKVDVRSGTIIKAEPYPEARKPAYKLEIDFGPEIGIKRSSVQITYLYKPDSLVGKQIIAVVNFPEKKIGSFSSQVLVLGLDNTENHVVLVRPDSPVANGAKLF